MTLPKDKAWFPLKTYGWGWGLPQRWQGWAAMGVFFAAVIAGAPLIAKSPLYYIAYCLGLTAVLVALCVWKGEKPRWQWGNDT